MYSRIFTVLISLVVLVSSAAVADAQTKRKKPPAKKTVAVTTPVKSEPKAVEPKPEPSVKRNERPADQPIVKATPPQTKPAEPPFKYEFTQPDFVNRKIIIEHDEKGVGKISFERRGSDEMYTDPLTISPNAMNRLNENFAALNFLDSTESYQHERDFSHMGNIRISVNRGSKGRVAAFNFTENKNAKALADGYRAIANQALWIFDITIARENQRLETPNQMKNLESLIKRNEISDPEQMIPFLTELSNDERLPLIARNNATRIIESIQKTARKGK